jgi:O-antigen/teichoic acid export membrane protein
MYLSRQLGAADWGRFNLCLAFVAMFATFANLGLKTLASRQMAREREGAGEYLGRLLPLRLLLAVAASLLAILAAPLAGAGSLRDIITILAVGQIVTTIAYALIDAFQAFEDARPASLAQFLGGCVLTLASVIVIAAGGGVAALALAYVLGPICTFFLLCRWLRGKPFYPQLSWQPRAYSPLLRQALPFFGIVLLGELGNRLDVVVLSRVLEAATLGCYTAAMALVDRGSILVDGVATALLPVVARLGARGGGDGAESAHLLRKAFLGCMILLLPIASLVSVFAPEVIGLIFGSQYAQSVPILAVGIWRLPLMAAAVVAGHALFAANRQDVELRSQALATLVALALLYPLALWLGPIGGAVVGCLRFLLLFALRLPALAHLYSGLWPGTRLARVGVALAVMGLPLLLSRQCDPGFARLLLAPLALACYAIALVALRVVSPEPLRALARRPLRGALAALVGGTR